MTIPAGLIGTLFKPSAVASAVVTDSSFANVSLLLHGDGANNATILDSSTNNFTITKTGNPAQGSYSPFTAGGGSIYFNGTTDYLTIPGNAALTLGSGDFTAELWVYVTTANTTYGFQALGPANGAGNTGWAILINRAANGSGVCFANNAGIVAATTGYLTVNTWYHVAVVRSGSAANNTKIYVNGVMSAQGTDTATDSYTGQFYIGSQAGGQLFPGYLDEIRYTKGVARYTANFAVPTAAFPDAGSVLAPAPAVTDPGFANVALLLHGDGANGSTTIADSSTLNQSFTAQNAPVVLSTSEKKFGTGSISFAGNGGFLSGVMPTSVNIQNNPFTLECWVKFNDTSYQALMSNYRFGRSDQGYTLAMYQQKMRFYVAGDTLGIQGTQTINAGEWYHIAVSGQAGDIKLFVNGVQDSSAYTGATLMGRYNTSNAAYIGAGGWQGAYLNGYIDDLRLTIGTARYTANFTVPTTAFPNA